MRLFTQAQKYTMEDGEYSGTRVVRRAELTSDQKERIVGSLRPWEPTDEEFRGFSSPPGRF